MQRLAGYRGGPERSLKAATASNTPGDSETLEAEPPEAANKVVAALGQRD